MSLVGYAARNHRQQVGKRGARPEIDDRAITAEDFASLHARFGFTVDAAATADNARLPRYWTAQNDALRQNWAFERVWCNPPHSQPLLERFVSKALDECNVADLIVMLVPANRTEQKWWQRLVEPHRDGRGQGICMRTEFLPGRMRFLAPGQTEIGPNERPPYGCCLLIWEW